MKNIFRMLACAFACLFGGVVGEAEGAQSSSELPVRTLSVIMEEGALPAFLQTIQDFSSKNRFAVLITKSSYRPNDILIQAWRDDIKIISTNKTEDNEQHKMRFGIMLYYTCHKDVPDVAFSIIVDRIKDLLVSTPGMLTVDDQ
ncbi:hypothetical protein [Marinimicrococcus flavescens]|uniref:Uncharacterized protein n=1 Tax=Marinimicrococcus flavescens TaxID=3031815 RepID=A0AAP3XQW1_9PROT|nr:hypothetical protein [Marinimicrococcus flavescens]